MVFQASVNSLAYFGGGGDGGVYVCVCLYVSVYVCVSLYVWPHFKQSKQ